MFEFASRVAVKVCGVTDPGDALVCAAAGAEMIGLNFSPTGLRCVTPTRAAEITTAVRRQFPQVRLVGVFVNQDLEQVRKITNDLAFDAVQLHGEESPEYTRNLAAPFLIKALRVGADVAAPVAVDYDCDAILLDTWSASAPGGTGETFPWSIAMALRPRVARLILAGGLTSENVANAIQIVRPFAVDVCSGVETAPGRKDGGKVRRFVAAVLAVNEAKVSR